MHDKIDRYYKDIRSIEWRTARDAHQHVLDVNAERRRHDDATADYVDLNNTRKWEHERDMRLFNYETQVRAYEKSHELGQKGFDLNAKVGDLSLRAQARVSYERKMKLQFEMQASQIKYQMNAFKMQEEKAGLQRKQGASHAKHMIASVESLSKLIQKQGKVIGRGQSGRSALKESEAIEAEYGRLESARFDLITREKEDYQAKMFGQNYALSALGMGRHYQKEAEALTYESIVDAHDKSVEQILLQKEVADLKTESQLMLPPRLAPMPPRPEAAPRTTILDPPGPTKAPKPPKGDEEHGWHYRGGSMGGGSVAQQQGFNVGSAMMTGGSMIAAAGTGAAAMGMTATAAVLGPIGIGIAVVGFLGSVFDLW